MPNCDIQPNLFSRISALCVLYSLPYAEQSDSHRDRRVITQLKHAHTLNADEQRRKLLCALQYQYRYYCL